MSKSTKVLGAVIVVIALLLAGFYLWGDTLMNEVSVDTTQTAAGQNAKGGGDKGGDTGPVTCTDSDGGVYADVAGYTTYGRSVAYDTCAGENAVVEQYCSDAMPTSVQVACDYGCENGSRKSGAKCTPQGKW